MLNIKKASGKIILNVTITIIILYDYNEPGDNINSFCTSSTRQNATPSDKFHSFSLSQIDHVSGVL